VQNEVQQNEVQNEVLQNEMPDDSLSVQNEVQQNEVQNEVPDDSLLQWNGSLKPLLAPMYCRDTALGAAE
jgi:hypothetical protein